MDERENYAIPLFALVDRSRVDLRSPQLPELAENLLGFLQSQFSIDVLDCRIEQLGGETYLLLNGTAKAALPRLLALADVQRTTLSRYQRDSADVATLIPLAIDPTAQD